MSQWPTSLLEADATQGTQILPAHRQPPQADVVFANAYPVLLQLIAKVPEGGVLVAACGPGASAISHGILDADDLSRAPSYVIVGRHEMCQVQVKSDPSVALRHLFVRTHIADGIPLVDIRDLRTGQGFGVPGVGHFGGLRSNGHVIVQLGEATVFILPKSTWSGRWPLSAEEAWQALPPMLLSEAISASKETPTLRRAPRPTWDPGVTFISALPDIQNLEPVRATIPEDQCFGVVTIEARGVSMVAPVTHEEMKAGLLIGRYERCQLGATLPELASWSRVHVLLLADGEDVLAFDTASTPGTVIDAMHINCARLRSHSVLALGRDVHVTWERA